MFYSKMKYSKGSKHCKGLVDTLKKQTHFSKSEIEKLLALYRRLTVVLATENDFVSFRGSSTSTSQANKREGIDRIQFRELLHNTFHILSEDAIMDRIFNAFNKRSDGVIHADEWVQGLSVFLKGTLQQKIAFTFFVYDINSDGVISKEEIHALLRNSLLKLPQDEDSDDSVKDLTDVALKKLDCDGDNKVSLQDYQKAVNADTLLLEALGQCLPTEDVCKEFLAKL